MRKVKVKSSIKRTSKTVYSSKMRMKDLIMSNQYKTSVAMNQMMFQRGK